MAERLGASEPRERPPQTAPERDPGDAAPCADRAGAG